MKSKWAFFFLFFFDHTSQFARGERRESRSPVVLPTVVQASNGGVDVFPADGEPFTFACGARCFTEKGGNAARYKL